MTLTLPPSLPPAPVRALRLDRKVEECWKLLPQLSARVVAFGIRVGQQNAEGLARRVEASFVLGDQAETALAAWIAVEGDRVVGHLLATQEVYNDETIGMVSQVAYDSRRVPEAIRRDVLFELEQWRDEHKFPRLLMITSRFRPRAWAKRAGFKKWREIYSSEGGTT